MKDNLNAVSDIKLSNHSINKSLTNNINHILISNSQLKSNVGLEQGSRMSKGNNSRLFQDVKIKRLSTAFNSRRQSSDNADNHQIQLMQNNNNSNHEKSSLNWNSNDQVMDFQSSVSLLSSDKYDPKKEYYKNKKKRQEQPGAVLNQFMFSNETHLLKSINGFDHIEEEVENDVQPWNIKNQEYEGNFQDGFRNGIGRMIYHNGDIYRGQFLKNLRHGSGSILFKDGRYFRGNWQNDMFHGRGIYKMSGDPDSLIIEGQFDSGHIVPGQVKIQYQNGEIYEGKVNAQLKREGQFGKFYFLNGDTYEGEWIRDKRQGKGKLFFHRGGEFEGIFKDDEIYDGKLRDKNDNLFANDKKKGGYFLRGKLHGYGKASFSNGDEYEGEFRDGVFSGKGKLIYKNLDPQYYEEATYIGQFRNHKREGYGEMAWSIGREEYKGLWKNDQRLKGSMVLSDGNVYDGEWLNDAFHGKGKLTFKSFSKGDKGITFEGQFDSGHQTSYGKLIHPNGDIYQGDLDEQKMHGKGILYKANGDIYDCQWIDDRKEGTGFIQYSNGDSFKGEFHDDKIDGFGTLMMRENKQLYIGNWTNNNKQGQAYLIYSDRNKYFEGNFKNNKPDGQGHIINEPPDMTKIFSHFNIPEDWNTIQCSIKIQKDIIQLLQRINKN
ncbi:phosphatidylinositol-4-phosphate 5- [Stylonychia lemnae]|uniref:Phosphatidylinositol-4-phosphate 5 n=1 Tax=Stylonychia lemnae TaxID=5949 RepID=A0A077ZRI6_STYLE|nr:phosphatidylinositol-4-phosphate 5- [Stylonychia lemnae]|eukprot:CDW71111.1 phosphatidylinositol-4-phosphate 5- [Stylonychia lemnae]